MQSFGLYVETIGMRFNLFFVHPVQFSSSFSASFILVSSVPGRRYVRQTLNGEVASIVAILDLEVAIGFDRSPNMHLQPSSILLTSKESHRLEDWTRCRIPVPGFSSANEDGKQLPAPELAQRVHRPR